MNIQISKINKEQQEIFLNLYNLYLFDLSEYNDDEPKEDGKFDPTNTYLYLEREDLYPFFIRCDGKIIGFILVCSPPFVPENIDFAIQELFVLKKYRGMDIAAQGVNLVLEKFEGKISVEQLKTNKRAVAFWKKYYNQKKIVFSEKEVSIEIDGLDGFHIIISQEFNNYKARSE